MTGLPHHHDTSLTVPAVGIQVLVFNDDGQVLLSQRLTDHGPGYYGGPGGGLDHGETPPDAARREAAEEANISISTPHFLCLTNFVMGGRHYLDIAFTATTNDTPERTEPDTHTPWEWFSLDNLPDPLFPPCEHALNSYRTGETLNW